MNTAIHRLLDEAFAGIETTPVVQDLKEEIRANLIARADELEAAGATPTDAAHRAVAELGDVRLLLAETEAAATDGLPRDPARYAALVLRHRVRPTPGFVVRAVVWSLLVVVGLTLVTLGATGAMPLPTGPMIGLLGAAATGVGLLIGDSLSQETTTSHPLPEKRASGFALAGFLLSYGLGVAGLVALQALPVWCVVFAALGVIASIILFAFLGATQTNRHKAWTRQARAAGPPSRFEEEPETAARFGIYTAVIWIVTFAIIAVLTFTVGWWWAPVAFVGGFVSMLLLLARMMFGTRQAG
ncbi:MULTISPECIES: permease prefix domain 1-containing protein [Bacteria]|uniref:permease prefix domain 1-containing protein n=1 Tax=Bacteria TaxID=2 RepID=UPI003C7D3388